MTTPIMPRKRGAYSDWVQWVRIAIQERDAGLCGPTIFWYEQFSGKLEGIEVLQKRTGTTMKYVAILRKTGPRTFEVFQEYGNRRWAEAYYKQRKERGDKRPPA